MSVAARVS
jgi:pre-mRNA-splicing factor ATP-dependent RNA helicase DHX16